MTQWLALWTSDRKVGGSMPGVMLLGVTVRWTSILSRGEKQYSQLLRTTETGDELRSCGPPVGSVRLSSFSFPFQFVFPPEPI